MIALAQNSYALFILVDLFRGESLSLLLPAPVSVVIPPVWTFEVEQDLERSLCLICTMNSNSMETLSYYDKKGIPDKRNEMNVRVIHFSPDPVH